MSGTRPLSQADSYHKRPLAIGLFGPPGTGKSTTIRTLRRALDLARDSGVGDLITQVLFFDLESLTDKASRIRALTNLGNNALRASVNTVVLGMADVQVAEMRSALGAGFTSITVTATISPSALAARSSSRNAANPNKRGQTPLLTLGGFTGAVDVFDFVVEDEYFNLLHTLLACRITTAPVVSFIAEAKSQILGVQS